MIVVVEGNFYAGKSTLCRELYGLLDDAFKNGSVVHLREQTPVSGTWRDENGANMLRAFHEDKQRWALTFQIHALTTSVEYEREAVSLSKQGKIVILERSSFSVLEIFDTLLGGHYTPPERKVFDAVKTAYPSPLKDYLNVFFLYLRTPPSVCYERISSTVQFCGKIESTSLEDLHSLYETKVRSDSVDGLLFVVDGATYRKGYLDRATLVTPVAQDRNLFNTLIKFLNFP